MKLSKQLADKMARAFRASLNKSGRDGLIYESFFHTGKETIHYAVEVKKNSIDCFDCHKGTLGEQNDSNQS